VKSSTQYKQHLRRVGFHDKECDKRLAFLTNNFELTSWLGLFEQLVGCG